MKLMVGAWDCGLRVWVCVWDRLRVKHHTSTFCLLGVGTATARGRIWWEVDMGVDGRGVGLWFADMVGSGYGSVLWGLIVLCGCGC